MKQKKVFFHLPEEIKDFLINFRQETGFSKVYIPNDDSKLEDKEDIFEFNKFISERKDDSDIKKSEQVDAFIAHLIEVGDFERAKRIAEHRPKFLKRVHNNSLYSK